MSAASEPKPRSVSETDLNRAFSVGTCLLDQGTRFVKRFDPLSYIALTSAMDLFDLEAGELDESLAPATCRWLLVSFSSDWLFPPAQSAQIAQALQRLNQPVTYSNIHTASGHDAFLLPEDLPHFAPLVETFLRP